MQKKLIIMFITMLTIICMAVPVSAAVKINKKSATLPVAKTLQLKISGTKKKVTWKSSNKNIASVSAKGLVTAKKNGTVTIKATVNKKKYSCKITVKDNVWKYTGKVGNPAIWKNLGYSNANTSFNIVKTMPVKLQYNKDGSLTGAICAANFTQKQAYELSTVQMLLRVSDKVIIMNEQFKLRKSISIPPRTYKIVRFKVPKDKVKSVADLTKQSIAFFIKTN